MAPYYLQCLTVLDSRHVHGLYDLCGVDNLLLVDGSTGLHDLHGGLYDLLVDVLALVDDVWLVDGSVDHWLHLLDDVWFD